MALSVHFRNQKMAAVPADLQNEEARSEHVAYGHFYEKPVAVDCVDQRSWHRFRHVNHIRCHASLGNTIRAL